MIGFQYGLRAGRHRGQLVLVRDVIGDFMLHDEFMRMIDGDRHVVTAIGTVFGLHRSTIRIGEGDLRGPAGIKLLPQVLVVLPA